MPPRPKRAACLWLFEGFRSASSCRLISSRLINLGSLGNGTVAEGMTRVEFIVEKTSSWKISAFVLDRRLTLLLPTATAIDLRCTQANLKPVLLQIILCCNLYRVQMISLFCPISSSPYWTLNRKYIFCPSYLDLILNSRATFCVSSDMFLSVSNGGWIFLSISLLAGTPVPST